MADSANTPRPTGGVRRPAIVIRTIEGRGIPDRSALPAARYDEQVRKLAKSGIKVPKTAQNR